MIEGNILAPVVVFAYNRVEHLKKTLDALSKNSLAKESELFIFSDGHKNDYDLIKVNEVRNYLKIFKQKGLFKRIQIFEASNNKGLATSIIDGVSYVIKKYKKIIVIEDDALTSIFFLKYMNEALEKYSKILTISSISSFVPNIALPEDYTPTVFLSMRPSSIAWGTWVDRWEKVDWELKKYPSQKYNLFQRAKLNSWGNDVAGRLDRYKAGMNNSWAVRFTVSGILKKQYTVHPIISLTKNIGLDNSGTHCSNDDFKRFSIELVNNRQIEVPDKLPEYDPRIKKEYQKKYKRSFLSEVGEFIFIVLLKIDPKSNFIKLSKKLSQKIKQIVE